ncbi:MAG: hypothetical protein IPP51_04735 [Bacteroidetes bacterium]|nr:hypothetical protein [Bacteroidota bacterium]
MIRIMPGIKVSAGETKSLAPYCRFGMILGIGSKLKLHEESTSNTTTYISEYEFTGGTSIGWYGAFGLSFKIGEKIRLITELNMINQTWGPDKFENTYNSDGSPLESPVTLSDTNSSTDPNTSLKSYFPFGSIGLNAGILIGL